MTQKSLEPLTNSSPPPPEATDHWLWDTTKTLGLSLLIAFGIKTFVAEARYIPSGSMEPTLQIQDRLLLDKVSYRFHPPQRGDMVVFTPPLILQELGFQDDLIKRVIGVPGDRVELRQGQVWLNGQPLAEPYTAEPNATDVSNCDLPGIDTAYLAQVRKIPSQHYLVLGDNRQNSSDGRCWGLVGQETLIGRAVFRFWPLPRAGLLRPPATPSSPSQPTFGQSNPLR